MLEIATSWTASSIINQVAYRLLAFVGILSFLFYFGFSLITLLVQRGKTSPKSPHLAHFRPRSQQTSPLTSANNSLFSLLSDGSSASTLILTLSLQALLKTRKLGSPLPENSDSIFFDHRAFYQTLNNSSHYLRRDSFAI